MKTKKERKRSGWFSYTTKEFYVTEDGKEFYDKEVAEEWEWFLNNKTRMEWTYKFTEVSPLTLGLHYISNPIFSYKFYIENYSKEIENEIVLYLKGLIKEQGRYNSKENLENILETIVKSNIINKIDGWYVVILNDHFGLLEIFYLNDLVTNLINE